MIGEPTNFVHTGHIGSGDVSSQNGAEKVSDTLRSEKSNNPSPPLTKLLNKIKRGLERGGHINMKMEKNNQN